MPELPEVEVTAQALRPALVGGQVMAWTCSGKRLRHPLPRRALADLVGQPLVAVGRRAKYVLLEFPKGWLAVHLGMSGSLQCVPCAQPPQMHDHLRMTFRCGDQVLDMVFHDPRRFGSIQWVGRSTLGSGDIASALGTSARGIEPLDSKFTGAYLFERSRQRQTSVKSWLMSGETVVGVGNIYACEALFAAQVHPKKKAGALSKAACEALAQHIRRILQAAIAHGGSTISDFVSPDGQAGRYGQSHQVYGHEGDPCPRCGPHRGTRIRRIVQQQRSTFYCHGCQR